MNWISTTIKKKYMDKILSGKKTSEYKKATDFWEKRLSKYVGTHDGDLGINFLCGQESYKFRVRQVARGSDFEIDIDGEPVWEWYEIHLGERMCDE